ncbi:MAG: FkbM family methyltransferase [Gammaproteobacteria bacterium]|nr:FkbM family methyltransferase [Gammaproteobacteria bacterium]
MLNFRKSYFTKEIEHIISCLELEIENGHKFFNKPQPVRLFGAGSFGIRVCKFLLENGFEVVGFLDNNPNKQGFKCFDNILTSLPDKSIINDTPIIIASTWSYFIRKQLKQLGCNQYYDASVYMNSTVSSHFSLVSPLTKYDKAELLELSRILFDKNSCKILKSVLNLRLPKNESEIIISPYSDYNHPLVKPKNGATIIDCGSYNGDTYLFFDKISSGTLKIHLFEPDKNNFIELKKNIKKGKSQAILNNSCVWDKNEELNFSSSKLVSDQSCHVSNKGDIKIGAISLDNYCNKHQIVPSYIKMDIEGAEFKALKGAKEILCNHQPCLAISVYHYYKDLWQLPMYLKKINPSYQFFLGHHRDHWSETVLYAI